MGSYADEALRYHLKVDSLEDLHRQASRPFGGRMMRPATAGGLVLLVIEPCPGHLCRACWCDDAVNPPFPTPLFSFLPCRAQIIKGENATISIPELEFEILGSNTPCTILTVRHGFRGGGGRGGR